MRHSYKEKEGQSGNGSHTSESRHHPSGKEIVQLDPSDGSHKEDRVEQIVLKQRGRVLPMRSAALTRSAPRQKIPRCRSLKFVGSTSLFRHKLPGAQRCPAVLFASLSERRTRSIKQVENNAPPDAEVLARNRFHATDLTFFESVQGVAGVDFSDRSRSKDRGGSAQRAPKGW